MLRAVHNCARWQHLPAILNDGAAGAQGCHSEHVPRIEFRQYREAVEGARARSTAERHPQDIALEIGFLMARINVTIQLPRAEKAHILNRAIGFCPSLNNSRRGLT